MSCEIFGTIRCCFSEVRIHLGVLGLICSVRKPCLDRPGRRADRPAGPLVAPACRRHEVEVIPSAGLGRTCGERKGGLPGDYESHGRLLVYELNCALPALAGQREGMAGRGPAPLICCQDSGLPVTLVSLGLNHLAVVKDSLKSRGLLGTRPARREAGQAGSPCTHVFCS